MSQSIENKVLSRIKGHGRGWAFIPKDFLDLSSRGYVGRVLSDLTKKGQIRRIARGLYDYPRVHPDLGGQLSPDIDHAARAIARKHRWTILPEPALAANMLGVSQQVPAKIVYLSDGPTKTIKVGPRTLRFKHASPKTMDVDSPLGGLVVQSLRFFGSERVTEKAIKTLRNKLSPQEKRRLLKQTQYKADWLYEAAQKIAQGA